MSDHRRLLIIVLFGLFVTILCTSLIAQAQVAPRVRPVVEEEEAKTGEWLQLIKSANPTYVTRGSPVEFTIIVLNNSDKFGMKDLVITDPLTPSCELTEEEVIQILLANFGEEFLPPNGDFDYHCTDEDVQVPFTNRANVSGTNATNGKKDSDSGTARIEVLELSTNISAEIESIAAPGGPIEFSVAVTNLSSVDVPLTSLDSPQFGNLADPQNDELSDNTCAPGAGLPVLSKNGGSFKCSFTFNVLGSTGDHTFVVNSEGEVNDGTTVESSGTSIVKIYEVIAVSLTADQDRVVVGGDIILTTTIRNLDESNQVKIVALEDAILGDIGPHGDCSLPQTLAPGDTYSCFYEQTVTGAPGEEQSYILKVSAETETRPPAAITAQASATVMVFEPIIHLPIIAVIPRPTSCSLALMLKTNTNYQFYPDTEHAVYRFVLADKADVTIELTNFISQDGQLIVYKFTGEECDPSSRVVIGHDGDNTTDKLLPLGEQQPDIYYIHVYSGSDLSDDSPYSLFVRTQ